jgi:hypothetical protein
MLDHDMNSSSKANKGSFVLEPRGSRKTLVLTGAWTPEAENVLLAGEADGLELNYARGSRERDLEFIGSWPVRWLRIIARTFRDLSPIYRLSESLEELDIQTAAGTSLDLGRLPRVSALAADWETMRESIESTHGLRRLTVLRFTERDLETITNNHDLRELVLKQAPFLEGLGGLGSMPLLKTLGIYAATPLKDLSELTAINRELTSLILEACPSIGRIGDVASLTRLYFLGFSECQEIDSLAPIAALRELEVVHCWGNTKIVDNDLEPFMTLPKLTEIRMRDRPQYHPRVKDIQAELARRR